jgi:hypothetical protein
MDSFGVRGSPRSVLMPDYRSRESFVNHARASELCPTRTNSGLRRLSLNHERRVDIIRRTDFDLAEFDFLRHKLTKF